jgi:hypothetical protein
MAFISPSSGGKKTDRDRFNTGQVIGRERVMAPRFVFAVYSVALGLAIIFAVATTIKHAPSTRTNALTMRVG